MTTKSIGNSAQHIEGANLVTPVGAESAIKTAGNIHDGIFDGISGGRLVLSTEQRKLTFAVASDVFVCCDGVTCGIEHLKVGSKIRLTTQVDNKSVATHVEALIKKTDFADHH